MCVCIVLCVCVSRRMYQESSDYFCICRFNLCCCCCLCVCGGEGAFEVGDEERVYLLYNLIGKVCSFVFYDIGIPLWCTVLYGPPLHHSPRILYDSAVQYWFVRTFFCYLTLFFFFCRVCVCVLCQF